MKAIKKLSQNELTECIGALENAIYQIEKRYSHISEFLQTELIMLNKKHSQLCDEYERREEEN